MLIETIARLRPVDKSIVPQVVDHLNRLTKPPGSLGQLESLAVNLATVTGEPFPRVSPPGVLVFAADHGVAAEGVSAFPQSVTAQMVANFVAGGAAINVFAQGIGARLEVIDVGVAEALPADGVVNEKVRLGTANFTERDAMSAGEAERAIEAGIRAAERAVDAGCRCLVVGEMGIANTTTSSALLAVLTGKPVASLTGQGTGIAEERLAHKRTVIERAIAARAPAPDNPLEVLAKLGGLEIAAMVGAYLGGAARRVPLLVDGFIATTAALLACRLSPAVRDYLIFGHRSREPGHAHALAALGAHPLLDLELRLGEGTGAALAFPLLEAASRMLADMATFEAAGVDTGESD
ncbi:nicotinate-nucleotide--dimethylbenzimidazole phosphoribosyltransferase [Halomonas campisalis]|uniref:Nicotinate-nucleotide--dimethylbenzimidazole phosphoribosyltransferase n=1 Tax=Billgrantia campisalis TaxID=74661 RepID=A0ABS9PBY2_9GAMM|nr:nicotinate-nucleotide--dimethylbenzimidazole phosphoribosyltransferase [Halomonas campisalis]MCG6659288.1 nicotinate-nucleotide--dimethylbenzimidazole phosphoribosyltransferase [Halomonas campisalis]MDR5864287.1 nicotinate-nucleotide--dimethylbenzimidazole phosphoribosyltransferase [Halomonas campisalis]